MRKSSFVGSFTSTLIVLFTVLLTACATKQGDPTELGFKPNEETESRRRAKIRLELGVSYYQQNQAKIALDEIANALQIDSEFSEAYMMRGLILMDAKQNLPAEESFKLALKYSPKDPDVNNAYGWFLCQNGRQKDSFLYFNIAADTPFYTSPAKPLQNAGICAASIKDLQAAESYFQRAFQIDPNQPATLFHMGRLYLNKRDLDRASFYANRLQKNFASSPEIIWLSLRIAHFLGDTTSKANLANSLRKDFPTSREWGLFQQEVFND